MTGRQLAEVIKQVGVPETPVVLLTGGDEIDEKETASSAVDAELQAADHGRLPHTVDPSPFPVCGMRSRKVPGDAARGW